MEKMFWPYGRYFEFSGRSTRAEYWLFTLFTFCVVFACIMLGGGMALLAGLESEEAMLQALTSFPILLIMIFAFFSFIPALAVTVRRFHDAGFSGWVYVGLIILSLIPYVGWLANIGIFVITLLPSVAGNQWGEDPHDDWQRDDNYGYDRPEPAARPNGVRFR